MSGLMTVNAFLKKLIEQLVNNNHLFKLYEIKHYKAELEALILEGDFNNKRFKHLRTLIIKSKEDEHLAYFAKQAPRIEKIIHLLENILKEDRYKKFHNLSQKLHSSIRLTQNHIGLLHWLAKKQRFALKWRLYSKFLGHLKDEKELLLDVNREFVKLGVPNALEQSIKIVKTSQEVNHDLSLAGYGSLLILVSAFTLFATGGKDFGEYLNVMFYVPMVMGLVIGLVGLDRKRKLRKLLESNWEHTRSVLNTEISFSKNSTPKKDSLNKTAVQVLKYIQNKYDVKVSGEYNYTDIIAIKKALSYFYPAEVKNFLRRIHFIPRRYTKEKGEGYLSGRYNRDEKTTTLISPTSLTTVMHEFAHGITHTTRHRFKERWRDLNKKGIDYKQIKKKRKSDYRWDDNSQGLKYGYFRAYGSKDAHEDVSTAVEFLIYLREKRLIRFVDSHYSKKQVFEFKTIYFSKAELLYQYGYIRKEDFLKFKDCMDAAERKAIKAKKYALAA